MSRCHAVLLFMTLKKKHFEAVQAPRKTEFPRPWLLKTSKPLTIDLRAGRVFQTLMAFLPSILGKLLQFPLPVDLADPSHSRKAFEKSKRVEKPMTEIGKGVHLQSCMSHALDPRHNVSQRHSNLAKSSFARVFLTVLQSNAAPSCSAHQQTHSDVVPSVGIRIVHDAAQQAERHSEPLAPARAKQNTRDRWCPCSKLSLACRQNSLALDCMCTWEP